jgi:hypothetical protein
MRETVVKFVYTQIPENLFPVKLGRSFMLFTATARLFIACSDVPVFPTITAEIKLTAYEEKPPPEKLFTLPKDYQVHETYTPKMERERERERERAG